MRIKGRLLGVKSLDKWGENGRYWKDSYIERWMAYESLRSGLGNTLPRRMRSKRRKRKEENEKEKEREEKRKRRIKEGKEVKGKQREKEEKEVNSAFNLAFTVRGVGGGTRRKENYKRRKMRGRRRRVRSMKLK